MLPHPARKALAWALFLALLGYTGWRGSGGGAARGGAELGFELREVAREIGIDFAHRKPAVDPKIANIEAHVAAVGAAVSVADADGDGRLDLYATTSRVGKPNALFRQEAERAFRDVAAEAGLADVNEPGTGWSTGSVWADLDGDGLPEVYLNKWGRPRLFRNLGELRFEDRTEGAGLPLWVNSNAATFVDFDRDGNLDLYIGGYFREDLDLGDLETTRIMQESFEFAANGGRNHLLRNLGEGRFEDVTAVAGGDSRRWTFAVVAADFDEDGWQDVYLANDYGPEELFLNVPAPEGTGRRLELQRRAGLDDSSKSGMSASLGDVGNEGRIAVFVTNISERGFLFQGNNLRVSYMPEAGRFLQRADGPVADCGWAWGAQLGDLDNDGWQDLFVTNGFVSASPDRHYWYDMAKIGGALSNVFEDARNWPAFDGRSLSGYQRSRLLLNRRGKGFVDVAEAAGVEDVLDGRAAAFADLFDRGALDVVVANQGGPLLVYANEQRNERRWAGLDLVGRGPNRDAIGAAVVAEFRPDRGDLDAEGEPRLARQVRVVTAASGFSAQNDRRLHFGLGDAERIERVEVRWPSGLRQEVRDLAAGRYHRVEEPAEAAR